MKIKIVFNDIDASQHIYSVKRLFERLQGIDIIKNNKDDYIVETSDEDAIRIIEDMSLLGYIRSDKIS